MQQKISPDIDMKCISSKKRVNYVSAKPPKNLKFAALESLLNEA
jgi:hypothetical protein